MGRCKYVNDTNQAMRNLQSLFEGILDNDLIDMEITWGDVCDFAPKFNERMDGPSAFGGYAWDSKAFWAQFDGIKNAWTENKFIARKNPIRLNYIKSDIRHGFAMYLLTRSIDQPMTQKAVDGYAKEMEQWCNTDELRIQVKVEYTHNEYKFTLWNSAFKDSLKSYMGYFFIKRRPMTESLLDSDFDIHDEELSINSIHPIDHKMWQVIPAMSDRIYQNATKAFFDRMPKVPEHVVNSGFGTRNICRYFIDWLAIQPIGTINDDQFTVRDPQLGVAFNEWVGNPKFTISMAKTGNTKYVYFNYNKVKMLRIKFQ